MTSVRSLAVLALAVLVTRPSSAAGQQLGGCCVITAIDAANAVVSARDTATGNVFEFKPRAAALLGSMRVGQRIQANFARNQVSVDGRSVCCTITKGPAASGAVRPQPAQPGGAQVAGAQPPGRQASAEPRGGLRDAAASVGRLTNSLPQVTYGEPIPAPPATSRRSGPLSGIATRTVTAKVRGRETTAQLVHLNGRDAIDKSGLPEGPRNMLAMHVRTLKEKDSQYYIVNPQLAAQWAAEHPQAEKYKPKKEEKNDSECGKQSINGYIDCGNDAVEATREEIERARKRAQDWYDESMDKLAREINEAASCFADHKISGPATPVKFTISPRMSVDLEQSGSRGVAKGTAAGTVSLEIPMQSDFEASMEFFYIPCLPFVFRPRSISADGTLTVGQQLTFDVTANGSFEKRFTIPPTGQPQIPLYVIPIVIGDVPVAVIDVSAYIEGEMNVKGEGKATGRFTLTNSNRSTFDFECDGGGCKGTSKGNSAPVTTSESAQIEGQLSAEPGIYTALQLSFDYNVLQGRAGPQPYLLGVANGCGAMSATQQSGGASAVATNAALTADLDWGVKLRAEALAGGQRIGDRWETRAMEERHIWFRDMAPGGSTALVPDVTGAAQAAVGQPAVLRVKMPTCYPYADRVHYKVTLSGNASATIGGGTCTAWLGGVATCIGNPAQDLVLTATWPSAGAQTVSVQLLRDRHRVFTPALAARLVNINVGSGQ